MRIAGTSPTDPGQFPVLDADGDGVTDALDKCPTVPDPAQTDTDMWRTAGSMVGPV